METFTESHRNSPEDESEDEYVTELTRQMTDYMLQDDEKHQKSTGGSNSPQSTLWSPFSPLGPSREPSPSLTPATVDKNTTKVDMNLVLIPLQSKKTLIDQQIRSVQTNFNRERRKEQRVLKRRNDGVLGNSTKATSKQCGSGARTGSGGTGVFLPRGNNSDVESRNQTAISRVIIPARVVEALKLHHHKMGLSSSLSSSNFSPHHDALMVTMKNKTYQKSSSNRAQSGPPYSTAMSGNSHREPPAYLPSEWTY